MNQPTPQFRALLIFALGLALAAAGYAQVSRGAITGRVTDPQKAVVPGAQIVATETSTGTVYKAVTSGDGTYTVPFLAPGTYSVAAASAGFKHYVREGVIVGANEQVGVDIHLQVGQQVETVTVSGASPLLETASASTGQVLNQEDIENMPVDGRTPLILAQLAYGVIPTGNPQFYHPYDNSGPSSFSLGGGKSKGNEILMDGTPDGGADGTLAYSPPMDATQQVKVESFQVDAAYGHTSGGTLNQVTKAGTNQFHGSAYEFNQVSALAATPFFTNRAGQKKSVTRFNQYGGSLGGPIVIPKVYDGHNKLFFFFAYEGIKNSAPGPTLLTVPTDAERQGDFSALLNLGSNYTIYDPTSGVKQGSRVVRKPISYLGKANVIPPSMLNKIGQNLVSYFGEPNLPGLADGSNNFYSPGPNNDSFDSELGRIDVNIGSRDKLFYDFRHNYRYHISGNAFGNPATGSILIQPNWGSTLDNVYTFSPSWVWENRFNWTRNTESRPPQGGSFDFSQLGFPTSLVAASTKPIFPTISGTKYVGFGDPYDDLIPFDSFQIFSIVNHIAGRHSLQFGADLRLYKESSVRWGNSSGSYNFGLNSGQGWTNGPDDNSSAAPIGQELASMLIGLPTSGSFDLNSSQTTQADYFAVFLQDNIRLSTRLTVNAGLRYERDLPTTERHNESVNGFALSAVNPINAAAQAAFAANPVPGVNFPTLMGGLTFASPSDRDLYQTGANNFSPRLGFAWTPVSKTVLRGGIGTFYDSVGREDAIASGFNQTTALQASLDGYLTPAITFANPFPDGLIPPSGSSLGLATFLGQGVSYYRPKLLNSYSLRWNLDLQQELPGAILMEIGYVGNHGVHLGIGRSLNYVPRQDLSYGQSRNQAVVNNLTANVANPFQGLLPGTSLNGATVQKQQLLLPYPQFTSVSMSGDPVGSSYFDMLETRLEKRFSRGLQFLVNYSWSKNIDRNSFLNPSDPAPEKRISSDDRPQRLVGSVTWELPFGTGKPFRTSIPVANYVSSGWKSSAIYVYQPDGPPLSWGDVIYLGGSLNNLTVHPHDVDGAFDTSQFDRKSGDQPVSGTHIRTLPSQVAHARQDGINQLDLSLVKSNRITEKVALNLRADFFNSLNHPNFSGPNLSPTSSSFGLITSQANLPRSIQLALRLVF